MDFLDPVQILFGQLPVFLLVLFRIAGLLMVAPVFSSMVIPVRVKMYFCLVLAMAVFPVVPQLVAMPNSIAGLLLGVAGEMMIGLAMGFLISILFVGLQMGAELVAQQMGLSFATLVDPMSQAPSNVLGQFYLLLATVIFMLLGGHIILVRELIRTFGHVPLMGLSMDNSQLRHMTDVFVMVLSGGFLFALRIAGPALVTIFLATLAMGFISRTMPQLNILAAGFPVRISLSLILLVASMTMVFWVFRDNLATVLDLMRSLFL